MSPPTPHPIPGLCPWCVYRLPTPSCGRCATRGDGWEFVLQPVAGVAAAGPHTKGGGGVRDFQVCRRVMGNEGRTALGTFLCLGAHFTEEDG